MPFLNRLFWAGFHVLRILVLAALSAFYPLIYLVLIVVATIAAFNTLFMAWLTSSFTSLPVLLSLATATSSALVLMFYGSLVSLFASD